jgi:dihydrolipoamide dehydrogenase
MRHVDVAIIGAGTAGLAALREVRRSTESFVIVDEGPGGTLCARAGCMPSKALIEAANAYDRRRDFTEFGIEKGDSLAVDSRAVLARVRRVRDELVADTRASTRAIGDRFLQGRARLLGPDRIDVDGETIRAGRVILATGSRPVIPAALVPLSDRLLTTDTLFEQESLPASLAVLGLGPVGSEMAQAIARLGCRVEAFETNGRVAGLSDPVVCGALLTSLRRDLSIHLDHPATVERFADGLRVVAGPVCVHVERVLVALGRTPNLDGLGLENLGVPLDAEGRPPIDPHTLQVSTLPVFVVGDAAGDHPVLHEASDEGVIAGRNAYGPVMPYRRRVRLDIVFTSPNAVVVGTPPSRLEEEDVVLGAADFEHQGRARLGLRGTGHLRIYADRRSGTLLGAELGAPDGEHLGHFLALAIERRCTALDLLRTPFYHPCLEEGLRHALRAIATRVDGEHACELAPLDGNPRNASE